VVIHINLQNRVNFLSYINHLPFLREIPLERAFKNCGMATAFKAFKCSEKLVTSLYGVIDRTKQLSLNNQHSNNSMVSLFQVYVKSPFDFK